MFWASKMKIKSLIPFFLISIIISGCANNKALVAIDYFPPESKTIALLEPDVELSEHTVGGLLVPKAEWTKLAKNNLIKAIQNKLNSIKGNIKTINMDLIANPDEKEIQLMKTMSAMGMSILIHNYVANSSLPTKEDNPIWSMGKETSYLKRKYKADYGLLFYVRDQFTSSSRQATKILAALIGIQMAAAIQQAYAGIVDLENGQLVWFNHLLKTTGDTRTEEGANEMIFELMKDMPS